MNGTNQGRFSREEDPGKEKDMQSPYGGGWGEVGAGMRNALVKQKNP